MKHFNTWRFAHGFSTSMTFVLVDKTAAPSFWLHYLQHHYNVMQQKETDQYLNQMYRFGMTLVVKRGFRKSQLVVRGENNFISYSERITVFYGQSRKPFITCRCFPCGISMTVNIWKTNLQSKQSYQVKLIALISVWMINMCLQW